MDAARLSQHELTHPFGLLARRQLMHLAAVKHGLSVVLGIARDQIAEQFASELEGRSAVDAEALLDNLALVTSFESYDLSRSVGVMFRQGGSPYQMDGGLNR